MVFAVPTMALLLVRVVLSEIAAPSLVGVAAILRTVAVAVSPTMAIAEFPPLCRGKVWVVTPTAPRPARLALPCRTLAVQSRRVSLCVRVEDSRLPAWSLVRSASVALRY